MYLYIIQRERARESARARERVHCMHAFIHNVCITFNSIYMHYVFRVFYQSFACACILCIHIRTRVSTNTLHLSTGIYLFLHMHIYTNIYREKTQSPKASLSCLTTSQPSGSYKSADMHGRGGWGRVKSVAFHVFSICFLNKSDFALVFPEET
jgi:hypothetical protein